MCHARLHVFAHLALLGMHVLAAVCPAQALPELDFLVQLRQQRSYEEVEVHSERLWQADDLSDAQRCDLAIALAETFAQQACETPPALRATLWEKAERAMARFVEHSPESPRILLIDIERALLLLARGDLERTEAASRLSGVDHLQTAHELLRRAIGQFEGVLGIIDERLSRDSGSAPRRNSSDPLSTADLEALRHNLRFHIGRARISQARCYAAGSADRVNALQLALEQLQHHIGQPGEQRYTWPARVDTLTALRDLGEFSRATELLANWKHENPPAEMADRLAAEQLRLQLSRAEIELALKSGREQIEQAGAQAGQLRLAYLEVLVAASASAGPEDEDTRTKQVIEQLARIRASDDPLLVRQAEILVGQSFAERATAAPPDVLSLVAENLYHSGRMDDALRAYDRAVVLLRRDGSTDRAFELARTAAAIEHHRGNEASAVRRYVEAARIGGGHPHATEAHRAAVLLQADVVRTASPHHQSAELSRYAELLDEHLRQWPEASTANDVRWWRAKLHMAEQHWAEAIPLLIVIEPSHQRFAQGIGALAECYKNALSVAHKNAGASSHHVQHLLASATLHLQPIITGPDNRWPIRWTEEQICVAEHLALFHLEFSENGSNYADRLLRAVWSALDNSPAAQPHREQIGLLFVRLLASNGAVNETVQLVSEPWARSSTVRIELIKELSESLNKAAISHRSQIADLVLQMFNAMPPDSAMSRAERVALLRHEALALATVGRINEATDRYRELAESHPRDGEIQEAYAELLSRGESADSDRKALAQWTAVEKQSRRGGERWRRARQARTQLMKRLGDAAEAEKLERLTELLYP